MKTKLLNNHNESSKTKKAFFPMMFALGMLLGLIIAILCPLGTIWALNTLFGLQIQYTFWNWLAMVVLIVTLQASLKISRRTVQFDKKSE